MSDSKIKKVFVSKDKLYNISRQLLCDQSCTIQNLAFYNGLIESCFPAVTFGPHHYRELEKDKCLSLRLNCGEEEACSRLCEGSIECIKWWIGDIQTSFRSIQNLDPSVVPKPLTKVGALFK